MRSVSLTEHRGRFRLLSTVAAVATGQKISPTLSQPQATDSRGIAAQSVFPSNPKSGSRHTPPLEPPRPQQRKLGLRALIYVAVFFSSSERKGLHEHPRKRRKVTRTPTPTFSLFRGCPGGAPSRISRCPEDCIKNDDPSNFRNSTFGYFFPGTNSLSLNRERITGSST